MRHFFDAPLWHGRCGIEGAPGGSSETSAAAYRQALSREYPPVRTLFSSSFFGVQTMRSRKGYLAFAEITIRSEVHKEELRKATYLETAAAIFFVLAEFVLAQ